MIEDWKLKIGNDYLVCAILMDLSKAFDIISHDLLIVKLHAFGFEENFHDLFKSQLTKTNH